LASALSRSCSVDDILGVTKTHEKSFRPDDFIAIFRALAAKVNREHRRELLCDARFIALAQSIERACESNAIEGTHVLELVCSLAVETHTHTHRHTHTNTHSHTHIHTHAYTHTHTHTHTHR
jgi:hypothetical protein